MVKAIASFPIPSIKELIDNPGDVGNDAEIVAAILGVMAPLQLFPGVLEAEAAVAAFAFLCNATKGLGIKGAADPIHDAQTTRTFNPGDPAARL